MTASPKLDKATLPVHVAIIMDGNGRWAKQRGLPRTLGHKAGVDTVRRIVEASRKHGIRHLTLYAFSTENWKRPPVEVQALMALLKSFLASQLDDMLKNDVALRCIGQTETLPKDVRSVLMDAVAKTSKNRSLTLNLALSYGGRSEIVRAARLLAEECLAGNRSPDEITESTLGEHLYTAGQPDPDLVIRTGGESRLSNFLLWQTSYAEIYFTDVLWPDFSQKDYEAALADYQSRQRRFGKTGDQVTDSGAGTEVTRQ